MDSGSFCTTTKAMHISMADISNEVRRWVCGGLCVSSFTPHSPWSQLVTRQHKVRSEEEIRMRRRGHIRRKAGIHLRYGGHILLLYCPSNKHRSHDLCLPDGLQTRQSHASLYANSSHSVELACPALHSLPLPSTAPSLLITAKSRAYMLVGLVDPPTLNAEASHWTGSSYLIRVGRLGEVDSVSDELIPDHDLQLQLGVNHQLPPVAQRQVPLRAHVAAVAPNPVTVGLIPGLGSPQSGLVLVHHVTGINLGCRCHRLQGEIESTGRLVGFILQPPHRLVDPLPVVRDVDPDGIQVGVSDLFANLQIVISIIHKRLDVLGELEGLQPLVNDDRSVACHFGRCQIGYNSGGKKTLK
ncbi:hypothetical protein EYF80_024097 [Liparis tanakae]|uniref:Uncharacterized protein n=1 Tax=Liparis tanakae TaxID=230148 RepID=A0A4Z2HL39_9TELE|nr:hypothetical protein EYF80_024097 [Liparis tanakae]